MQTRLTRAAALAAAAVAGAAQTLAFVHTAAWPQPNSQPSRAARRGVARPTSAASRAIAASGSGQAAVCTKAKVWAAPATAAAVSAAAVSAAARLKRVCTTRPPAGAPP